MTILGRLVRWIRRAALGAESRPERPAPVPVAIRRIDLAALKEGDRVLHRQFQTGTILEINAEHIIVQFDLHGRRTLSRAHVRLYSPSEGDDRPGASVLAEMWHQQIRDHRRHEYEREFPYDDPETNAPVDRLSRRSPTVSGGLPSLGKKR